MKTVENQLLRVKLEKASEKLDNLDLEGALTDFLEIIEGLKSTNQLKSPLAREVFSKLAQTYYSLGELAKVESIYRWLEHSSLSVKDSLVWKLKLLNFYLSTGNLKQAGISIDRLTILFQDMNPENYPLQYFSFLVQTGNFYYYVQKYLTAEKFFRLAEESLEKHNLTEEEEIFNLYNSLGSLYWAMGDLAKSYFYFQKNLKFLKNLDLPLVSKAETYYNLAVLEDELGHYDKARWYFSSLLEWEEYLKDDFFWLDVYRAYAKFLEKTGDTLSAFGWADKMLNLGEKIYPATDIQLLPLYQFFGNLSYRLHKWKEAVFAYSKMLVIMENNQMYSEDDIDKVLLILKEVYEKMGNKQEIDKIDKLFSRNRSLKK